MLVYAFSSIQHSSYAIRQYIHLALALYFIFIGVNCYFSFILQESANETSIEETSFYAD